MRQRRIVRLIWGGLLGILALGSSGRLFDAAGMPPYPGNLDARKWSPQMAAAMAKYDELRATFAERGIDQPGGVAAGTHVSGSFHILVVCVDFSDHVSSVSSFAFDTLIFGNHHGSVRDYYGEVSYRTLDLTPVNLPSALGWQRLPQTMAYYVNNSYGLGTYPNNTQKLTEDLVDMIDPYVDFSQYDNDGDGYVDGLVIVHAGRGAELSGKTSDIWSHKWGIIPRLRDGVRISSYSIQPEYWTTPGDITIGVYAHEIGHLFGLPDLYDTDGSSRGIGHWSLMASGSWNGAFGSSPAHLDAWCKARVGFLTPINVTSNTVGATLPQVEDSAKVYRLWSDGAMGSEYFLIENRQTVGYDAGLPGAGALIWHIDETRSSNAKEWYPGYTSNGHYWVALEQADGLWQMEKNINQGDGGDAFPGSTNKTTFSAATVPNSNSYSGAPTYVTVTNISPSAATMTCTFQTSLVAGVLDSAPEFSEAPGCTLNNAPNPFNPATTIRYVTGSGSHVLLEIYDVLGRHVITLKSGEDTPGAHEIVWDGRDERGHPTCSGVYFASLQAGKTRIVRKMVLLR